MSNIESKRLPSNLQVYESGGFEYIDSGKSQKSPPILFLHGLLGNPEGWFSAASALASNGYRTIVPYIPIDEMPREQANLQGIVHYLREFTEFLHLGQMILIGNSLGGHIAVRYTTLYPKHVIGLLLSGSSGIYETEVGKTTFRRHDREYIRAKAEKTFYDPAMVTENLVERIYNVATDRFRALRIVWIARNAMHDLVVDELGSIDVPTLLIWGTEDQITPPDVAYTFEKLLPNAELRFIDECGHAPMMEYPDRFNELAVEFLDCTFKKTSVLTD